MFLLANQARIDRDMILRKCGYTGGYYRGQYQGHMRIVLGYLSEDGDTGYLTQNVQHREALLELLKVLLEKRLSYVGSFFQIRRLAMPGSIRFFRGELTLGKGIIIMI